MDHVLLKPEQAGDNASVLGQVMTSLGSVDIKRRHFWYDSSFEEVVLSVRSMIT